MTRHEIYGFVVDITTGLWLDNDMSKNATTKKINLRHAGGNWVIGTVDGLEVQAKVFEEPSHYGMELDGRISKLWVKIPGGQVLYSYDRGPDIDYLDTEGLAMIVDAVTAMK